MVTATRNSFLPHDPASSEYVLHPITKSSSLPTSLLPLTADEGGPPQTDSKRKSINITPRQREEASDALACLWQTDIPHGFAVGFASAVGEEVGKESPKVTKHFWSHLQITVLLTHLYHSIVRHQHQG